MLGCGSSEWSEPRERSVKKEAQTNGEDSVAALFVLNYFLLVEAMLSLFRLYFPNVDISARWRDIEVGGIYVRFEDPSMGKADFTVFLAPADVSGGKILTDNYP